MEESGHSPPIEHLPGLIEENAHEEASTYLAQLKTEDTETRKNHYRNCDASQTTDQPRSPRFALRSYRF